MPRIYITKDIGDKMEKNKQINSSLFKLSWPIFIELLLQILIGNVDQFMISGYSQNAVAAIGNANQIINVLILTFSVISMATTILLSLYLGSNNTAKVTQIYNLSLFVNVIFSVIVAVVLVGLNKQIFGWLQVPSELMKDSQIYISIIGSFIFLQGIHLTFSAILRSNALMKESMIISIIINILNIAGNALLLHGFWFVPPLGIVGVAISSNFSRFIGLLLMVYVFYRKLNGKLSFKYLKPFPFSDLKKLLSIGIPSGGENLSYNMSQMFILKFVNHFGALVVTSRVYANMFATFSYVYAAAISQATQILVGYHIGAKDTDGADQKVKTTLKLSLIVSLIVSITLYLLSGHIFGFFSRGNEEIIKIGQTIMFIEIFLELGRATNIVLVRCLQAAGDIKFPITIGILSQWIVSVGLAYVFGILLNWGLAGIWIAMTIDECVRGLIFILRWKSGVWKTKSLIA